MAFFFELYDLRFMGVQTFWRKALPVRSRESELRPEKGSSILLLNVGRLTFYM